MNSWMATAGRIIPVDVVVERTTGLVFPSSLDDVDDDDDPSSSSTSSRVFSSFLAREIRLVRMFDVAAAISDETKGTSWRETMGST